MILTKTIFEYTEIEKIRYMGKVGIVYRHVKYFDKSFSLDDTT